MPDPNGLPVDRWAANLMPTGDLAQAKRKRDLLKAQLEAIQRGDKKVNRVELARLQRQYKAAGEEVTRLEAAQAPIAPRAPTAPTAGGLSTAALARAGRLPAGGVPPVQAPGRIPPTAGGARRAPTSVMAGGAAGGQTGIQGFLQRLLGQLFGAGGGPAPGTLLGAGRAPTSGAGGIGGLLGGGQPPMPPLQPPAMGGAGIAGRIPPGPGLAQSLQSQFGGSGSQVGQKPGFLDRDPATWTMREQLEYANLMQQMQNQITPYQQQTLAQKQAEAGATAAWRQQQQMQAQASLKQAWAVAQAELAHAQNLMASQIGIGAAQVQGQMWGQALPYALPKGTQVAPGFERGGPASRLAQMGGSQFSPGRTGRISPYPQPSQEEIMAMVKKAMGQFGAGG